MPEDTNIAESPNALSSDLHVLALECQRHPIVQYLLFQVRLATGEHPWRSFPTPGATNCKGRREAECCWPGRQTELLAAYSLVISHRFVRKDLPVVLIPIPCVRVLAVGRTTLLVGNTRAINALFTSWSSFLRALPWCPVHVTTLAIHLSGMLLCRFKDYMAIFQPTRSG